MTGLSEAAQFLDIDVDDLAGGVTLIAARRLGGLQIAPAVEAVAEQDPSDGGRGNADFGGDAVVDAPFLAQHNHLRLNVIGRSVGTGLRL